MDYPIIEDGAAIFIEHCRHETVLNSERGYRGERVVTDSIPCEETRSFRFEYDYLEGPDGNQIDLPSIHNWDDVSAETEEKVLAVERSTWKSNDQNPDVQIDPDPDTGQVVVEHDGFTLRYAPQEES